MQTRREMALKLAALAAGLPVFGAKVVLADPGPPNGRLSEYSSDDIIANGHRFFGSVSRGLAEVVEAATPETETNAESNAESNDGAGDS